MEAMLKQMRENAAAKAAAVQQDQAPSVAALEEQAAALRDQYKAGGYSNIRNAEAYEMERPSTAAAPGQYDPNEHARKRKEAMEKASVLRFSEHASRLSGSNKQLPHQLPNQSFQI